LGFHDESGISEKPVIGKTWAVKGKTPVIISACNWKKLSLSGMIIATPAGLKPLMFLRVCHGSVKSPYIIGYLKELKKHLSGKKLLLIWDGLPAHRSKLIKEYLLTQKHWLRVERFPAYAPELNPIEYLWSAMKRKDLANLPPKGLKHLKQRIYSSKKRISNDKQLLKGFLKASGLY
jgi:transposase